MTANEVECDIAADTEKETQGRANVDRQTARESEEAHAGFGSSEPFTDVIQQPGGGFHEFTVERVVMEPLDAFLAAAEGTRRIAERRRNDGRTGGRRRGRPTARSRRRG